MIIGYKYDCSYELKNSDDNYLLWDFVVERDGKPYFIEYDGIQHFKIVRFGGMSQERAEEAFTKQKHHDGLKDAYCKDNDYELLRIPYTQYENIGALVAQFARAHLDWGAE